MAKFISPKDFYEEIRQRPDIQEILRRLAASGWDEPSVSQKSSQDARSIKANRESEQPASPPRTQSAKESDPPS
jgi:hypothetical protein